MKRRTRIFVRKQANWFKETDPDIQWFQASPSACDEMGESIMQWLMSINWHNIPAKIM
jgi:tRNA dimethylallyltransferase